MSHSCQSFVFPVVALRLVEGRGVVPLEGDLELSAGADRQGWAS
jgi:hypothetical protein